MNTILSTSIAAFACMTSATMAAEFAAAPAHDQFVAAFNARDWGGVRATLADDVVFHRANSEEVYVGPDAVMARWTGVIGAPDQWNVKFAELETDGTTAGKDGRLVERGSFAITAGADDSGCYAGSYLMTWAPVADGWRLQIMTWQDVETDGANCR